MKTYQWKMLSSIGPLYLVASATGLRGILWKRADCPAPKVLDLADPAQKILAQTVAQLQEYLEGKRREFQVPLDLQGTSFQKLVWKELTRIPYGTTRTYTEIAKRVRRAKAVRAVGTANARNPFLIVIPCHRVIAHNGTLAGYSGGLSIKEKLLNLECGRD